MRGECRGENMSPAEIPQKKKKSWKRCGQQLRFLGVLSLSGSFGVFSSAVTVRFASDKCIRDRGLFGLPACFHVGWADTAPKGASELCGCFQGTSNWERKGQS